MGCMDNMDTGITGNGQIAVVEMILRREKAGLGVMVLKHSCCLGATSKAEWSADVP